MTRIGKLATQSEPAVYLDIGRSLDKINHRTSGNLHAGEQSSYLPIPFPNKINFAVQV